MPKSEYEFRVQEQEAQRMEREKGFANLPADINKQRSIIIDGLQELISKHELGKPEDSIDYHRVGDEISALRSLGYGGQVPEETAEKVFANKEKTASREIKDEVFGPAAFRVADAINIDPGKGTEILEKLEKENPGATEKMIEGAKVSVRNCLDTKDWENLAFYLRNIFLIDRDEGKRVLAEVSIDQQKEMAIDLEDRIRHHSKNLNSPPHLINAASLIEVRRRMDV